MGILSLFSKLFKGILKILKKCWPLILIALVVVLSIYCPAFAAFMAPLWSALSAAWASAPLTTALVGLGVLAAVDPGLANKVVDNVSDVAANIADSVGEVAGSVVGGFLSSPGGLILLAGAAFFLLPALLSPASAKPSPVLPRDDEPEDEGRNAIIDASTAGEPI